MSAQRITTETGSIYIIDLEKKTWKRESTTEESGPIRTNEGAILNDRPITIEIGKRINILTDRINSSKTRFLSTSNVILIKEI